MSYLGNILRTLEIPSSRKPPSSLPQNRPSFWSKTAVADPDSHHSFLAMPHLQPQLSAWPSYISTWGNNSKVWRKGGFPGPSKRPKWVEGNPWDHIPFTKDPEVPRTFPQPHIRPLHTLTCSTRPPGSDTCLREGRRMTVAAVGPWVQVTQ